MEECQVLGLTKSIGANNFSSKKLEHILSVSTIPPAVNQVEISPVWQQNKLREFCQAKGIIVAANSPLGAKDTSWGTNRVMDSEVLSEIAKAKGKTHAQIYLRWAYEQGVCVVVKSFNEERIACLWHGLTSLIRSRMVESKLWRVYGFPEMVTVYIRVYNVYNVVQARKGSMLLALAMLYPFVVLLGGVLVWDYLSPSNLMVNYPHLVILGTGLTFGFLVASVRTL